MIVHQIQRMTNGRWIEIPGATHHHGPAAALLVNRYRDQYGGFWRVLPLSLVEIHREIFPEREGTK